MNDKEVYDKLQQAVDLLLEVVRTADSFGAHRETGQQAQQLLHMATNPWHSGDTEKPEEGARVKVVSKSGVLKSAEYHRGAFYEHVYGQADGGPMHLNRWDWHQLYHVSEWRYLGSDEK